jgi:glycosyltransferase involved in cell wall biosynthesis
VIDILIPVLRRPENARKVVDSIRGHTMSDYRILFICSPRDTPQITACVQTGAETILTDWNPAAGDYARKINFGFAQTDSEWIFQGADDVIFHPNWDVAAISASRNGKRVIGTNDLHNPSVKRGTHSTHTLIARSYIEERPATVDESDPVMWEGYDHQYVDLELVEVAKRRGEFQFAKQAIVEHFHPHWGNAVMDPTYRKATRRTVADRNLYRERMGLSRALTRSQRNRLARQARYTQR